MPRLRNWNPEAVWSRGKTAPTSRFGRSLETEVGGETPFMETWRRDFPMRRSANLRHRSRWATAATAH